MFMLTIGTIGAIAAACLAVDDAPPTDPDVGSGPCQFKWDGTMLVCATAVQECPNGAFTSQQVCASAVHIEACPGQYSTILSVGGSGRRLMLRCEDFVPPRIKSRCRCEGGLFGWCISDCRPTGGVAGLQPCSGWKLSLEACGD